ncbi:hypothetical protein EHI8A_000660 [Entamoeba histolytica HM-1:IMSS-B]|uniref:Uncharacterized protein n=5 Tax=Entamoeba histolytica TaxID=5759 RepID=C4LYX7_ENTH1|nr:hypothetical protein EHI_117930 [Entamoeba histolytica HM-1:IMSS]EMD42721.1 Hypothetical protein EHI5A_002630 [Entamoeba histolytica KU27]EMH72962.1 hypothetical protein EHI8A_000660 [Entamoeba histolytica HM-1:IMSS-B]EMS15685.1 hypothetical protein KM1_003500 [Entamoeba histolytica HM-3:IMSS]ENY63363.1 hypothetical protein EHI7A_000660 [Entamoeba histolytica HM-1:IMSS-A]EAL50679.2 hypothetical protein EHI_117930 [Entamoeba histolytica HM-1:IMSS]|eukprot:XP_656063.2 hypothetical protein EHI_117930 [Entamoeba histolytica HM-1:IMSS]
MVSYLFICFSFIHSDIELNFIDDIYEIETFQKKQEKLDIVLIKVLTILGVVILIFKVIDIIVILFPLPISNYARIIHNCVSIIFIIPSFYLWPHKERYYFEQYCKPKYLLVPLILMFGLCFLYVSMLTSIYLYGINVIYEIIIAYCMYDINDSYKYVKQFLDNSVYQN